MKKVAVLEVRYPAFDPELDNAPERPSTDPPTTRSWLPHVRQFVAGNNLGQPPGGYFRDMGWHHGTTQGAERMPPLNARILAHAHASGAHPPAGVGARHLAAA